MKILQSIILISIGWCGGIATVTITSNELNIKSEDTAMSEIVEYANDTEITIDITPGVIALGDPVVIEGKVVNSANRDYGIEAISSFPNCTIKVVKEDGSLLPYTESGESVVSPGRSLARGGSGQSFLSVGANQTFEFQIDLNELFQLESVGDYYVSCEFEGYGMPVLYADFELTGS